MVRYKNRPYCPPVQKNGQCNVCHEPDQILTVLWEMVVCWKKIIFRHISIPIVFLISFLSSSVCFYMKQFQKYSTHFREILKNFIKNWWIISKFRSEWTCLVTLHEDQFVFLRIFYCEKSVYKNKVHFYCPVHFVHKCYTTSLR
jgi:hypothetical protein